MSTFQDKLNGAAEKGGRVKSASLTFLSDLGSEDRGALRQAWPGLPLERRRDIVSRLAEMAEDNIELDFRHVFLNALDDADPDVRVAAIEGLFEDESRLLLTALLRLVRDDPDEAVREAAAKALARFTFLAHCDKLKGNSDDLRSTLMKSATNTGEDEDVRRRAVEALGYYTGDTDIEGLIAELYRNGGKGAESALFAMGRSSDAKWEPIIMHELESKRPAMRFEAARAAGEMALQDALPFLVRMSDDDADAELRLMALWSLGQIGGRPAREALNRALESPEQSVRDAAQEALDELSFNANPLF
jgi:HEAT repeat protein